MWRRQANTAWAPTATAGLARTSSFACRVGTIITDEKSGEVIADLSENGKKALVAAGGKGGLGNLHFKSPTNRAPRQFTLGEPGQARSLKLELKVLADVGLLGYPNAGKSTFITAVSNAARRSRTIPLPRCRLTLALSVSSRKTAL